MPTYNVMFIGNYATLISTVEVDRKSQAEKTAKALIKEYHGIDVETSGFNEDVEVEIAY